MFAHDKRFPDIYKKGQPLIRGEKIPNFWAIHFLKSDGTEMGDLYLAKKFEFSVLKDKMTLAVKRVGKGIPQAKFNKIRDEYVECAFRFEIREFKQAKKDFEGFIKNTKIKCNLVADAKEKIKQIDAMYKDLLKEAKEKVQNEDFESGFNALYELEQWYYGLKPAKEIKKAIKELTAELNKNKDAKKAIKQAKKNQAAMKMWQKAQGYYLNKKDAKGDKTMRKIASQYPDSDYSIKSTELIQIKVPLAEPKAEKPPTGAAGG
ncbi:MAG: hypothetical protein E3J72_07845 [Planctomycetota bacterium]|nr:MAG: hypothetical protein E3J72_07845 [Planctomycetota bacterium]